MANVKFYKGAKAINASAPNTTAGQLNFVEGTSKAGDVSVGVIWLDGYRFGSSVYNVEGTTTKGTTTIQGITVTDIDGTTKSYKFPDTAYTDTNTDTKYSVDTAQELTTTTAEGTTFAHEKIKELSTVVASDLNFTPDTSGTITFGGTQTITIKAPKVNEYGHVIGTENKTFSVSIPATQPYPTVNYPVTGANTELELKDKTVKHLGVSELNKTAASFDNTKFAWDSAKRSLTVVNASVNQYGHVIDKTTQTFTISDTDTKYSAATDLYTDGTVHKHKTVKGTTNKLEETTKSYVDLTPSIDNSGTTKTLTILTPKINQYGHVVDADSTKLTFEVPTPDYPVTSVAKGTSTENFVKLTVNPTKGDVKVSIDDSALATKFETLKAKDQFLKSVTYVETTTSETNPEYTTNNPTDKIINSVKTIDGSVNLDVSKSISADKLPALFFVWNTSTYNITSNSSSATVPSDYSFVSVKDLKDPHYTFEDTDGDGGVDFTTTPQTDGSIKVTGKVSLSNYAKKSEIPTIPEIPVKSVDKGTSTENFVKLTVNPTKGNVKVSIDDSGLNTKITAINNSITPINTSLNEHETCLTWQNL